jgi:3-deoxy-D-manno-octulosonic-acid transferase
MVLANARLSERSLRKGQAPGALLGPALRADAGAGADRGRCRSACARLGVRSVEVCGNLKFDVAPPGAAGARPGVAPGPAARRWC